MRLDLTTQNAADIGEKGDKGEDDRQGAEEGFHGGEEGVEEGVEDGGMGKWGMGACPPEAGWGMGGGQAFVKPEGVPGNYWVWTFSLLAPDIFYGRKRAAASHPGLAMLIPGAWPMKRHR